MPWTADEFRKRHNKGLSSNSASKAKAIANRLLAEGKSDAEAIRTANASVRPTARYLRSREQKKRGMPSG